MSADGASRPAVASLWIGGALNWFHALSLTSFARRGHAVTLYVTGEPPEVGDGIEVRPAAEIWDAAAHGFGDADPSMVSDLWRLHLLAQTDTIWIDTDMLCLRPFPQADYHIGREHSGMMNGAVLRLPKDSPALNDLLGFFADPDWIPPWLGDGATEKVRKAPREKRLHVAYRLRRSCLGPQALTQTLRRTKENRHVSAPEVYYPVRGVFCDAFFNPRGGASEWITPRTVGVHLYASMIRPFHRKHPPHPESFIARFADEIGFAIPA